MHSALLLAITALPFLGADALNLKCSTTARCGTQSGNKLTCKNSIFGNCCSKSGYCGWGPLYCGTGCQVGFGDCKSAASTTVKSSSPSVKSSLTSVISSTSSAKATIVDVTTTLASSTAATASPIETSSVDASSSIPSIDTSSSIHESSTSAPTPLSSAAVTSGSSTVLVTIDSSPAQSSSAPVTSDSPSTPSPSAPAVSSSAVPDVKVSTDGSCGGTQGFTCSGSVFGNCCSEYGYCGSTSIYCDAGCNAAFGNCNGASSSVEPTLPTSTLIPSSFTTLTRTTSAQPSPTQGVSTDGQCGATNGLTCLGSAFGDCCSQYNYCGSSSAFCGTGCQSGSGKCDAPPAPGNTCNAEGFANKAEYYASSFNLVDATDVSTCAALCLAEAECKSYLFNPGLGNCAYLKWSLSEGEFIATTTTNQFFWDRACAQA